MACSTEASDRSRHEEQGSGNQDADGPVPAGIGAERPILVMTSSRYVSLAEEQLHKDVRDHAL